MRNQRNRGTKFLCDEFDGFDAVFGDERLEQEFRKALVLVAAEGALELPVHQDVRIASYAGVIVKVFHTFKFLIVKQSVCGVVPDRCLPKSPPARAIPPLRMQY